MQDHGNNHKYCRKADRCKHFRIRKYLQVILEAYKFIDTLIPARILILKKLFFTVIRMGYTVVKPLISTTGRIKSHGIHFIVFLLIVMELSSLFIKQCKADFYLCFTLLFFFISFTYTYLPHPEPSCRTHQL